MTSLSLTTTNKVALLEEVVLSVDLQHLLKTSSRGEIKREFKETQL